MFPDVKGLTQDEARVKQRQYGLNILPEKKPPSTLSLILEQLKSPLVYVLLAATLVTAAIGHYSDSVIIFFAVAINTIFGFIQESKASNALYALKKYVSDKANVIRDGKRIFIETSLIVPGDLVVLNQGVKVPADGKIIFANRLYIDEAVITGESVAVEKKEKNEVFMGATISSGQGLMITEKTGVLTKIGRIAGKIQDVEEDTPLQKQLKIFSKQLVVIISTLVVITFLFGVIRRLSAVEMFTTSIALAVSSIPEGLLISLTVVLAIGMQRILKHRGLVKKLSAAETLGGVTTICVDKTGTLTQGKMKVVHFSGDERELAKQVLLANDLDDPIVISAFEWGKEVARKNSIPDLQNTNLSASTSKYKRLDSIPFSSKERFFISLNKYPGGKNMIFVNGAPELLLKWSDLPEKEKTEILSSIDELTKQGKRLIGFARKETVLTKKTLNISDAKKGLSWIGILAFSDPVRVGVKEAFEETESAGINTIVITGDYSKTSVFVLNELGISVDEKSVITGEELKKLSLEDLSKEVKSARLFARTTPDQKLMIVEALKKNGEIVAMMGDGVNDAPALHEADIGIAVEEATDVAKESADLILLDSNFSTIVGAIKEGRAMFENIRKIILYLMSDAFAEIIIVLGGILIGLPLPITAAQILWINLISDGFPGLALTIDPKRADIMKEKPRPPSERLVNRWMVFLIGTVSMVAGSLALASFFVVYNLTGDILTARSVAFVTLGLNSLAYVFSVRSLMVPFWKGKFFENKWLVLAVFAGLGLQILPFSISGLRQIFGLTALDIKYWLIAAGLSVFMFLVVEVFKSASKKFPLYTNHY